MTGRPRLGWRSLTVRLAVAVAAVGVLAAGLTALAVNLVFQDRFTAYVQQQQQARDQELVAALAAAYQQGGGWQAAELDAAGIERILEVGSVRLEDTTGRMVWSPPARGISEMTEMHRQMMGTDPFGPQRRLPVRVGGEVVGTAIVRSPGPGVLPADAAFRSSVNRSLLVAGAAGGVLALLVGGLLARPLAAPALRLTRAARAFAAGDRSQRITPDPSEELGEMGRAFNTMADTIEQEDRLRRAFAASVAHELRTPLAILRSQVEALQDGVVDPSPKELASLHEEVLRLGGHVADLETIAAADPAGFTLDRRPCPLGGLLETTAAEFSAPFAAGEVAFVTDLAELTVDGDPQRLRQVVRNLLANALKFTPPHGTVRLELRAEDEQAVIRVTDSGPGIPPDELPRVFDRFFRGRHATAGGSGIGLAVVRELITAHQGSVHAASEPGQGTIITVRLPQAA